MMMTFDEWLAKEKKKMSHAFFAADSIGEGMLKIKQAQDRYDLLRLASCDEIYEEFQELRVKYSKCIEARDTLEKEYKEDITKQEAIQ